MTLEPKKCVVGVEQTEILGHSISKNGISLVKNKVEAVLKIGNPKNKDHVRSVCGSFAYYLNFVPGLMCTLAPLYELLKKNVNFRWSEKHQKAFDKAKNDLANCTLRNHRNQRSPLCAVSDATDVGAGLCWVRLIMEKLSHYNLLLKYFQKPRNFSRFKCENCTPLITS